MLTRVLAVGNTKAKFEVKALEKLVPKIMSLNHAKIIYWFITDGEFNPVESNKYITN